MQIIVTPEFLLLLLLFFHPSLQVISQYTTPNAEFICLSQPQKTVAEYADFMKV